MSLELHMKYCETVYRRYRNASKESKARILDELCQVCGYNRKYAIWKLNRLRDKEKAKTPSKRRRSRKYGHEVLLIVEKVWKKSGYPWSVRLKEILRLWLPWIYSRSRGNSLDRVYCYRGICRIHAHAQNQCSFRNRMVS